MYFGIEFGHQILSYDMCSRLYYPHRISFIQIHHNRNNLHLKNLFDNNLDVFYFNSLIFPYSPKLGKVRYKTLKLFFHIYSFFNDDTQVIQFLNLYKTLSLSENKLTLYNENQKKINKSIDLQVT